MKLPNNVQYILEKFNSNGFEAFIVGGCVRDSLLNKNLKIMILQPMHSLKNRRAF